MDCVFLMLLRFRPKILHGAGGIYNCFTLCWPRIWASIYKKLIVQWFVQSCHSLDL